jgi:hypothetical protein
MKKIVALRMKRCYIECILVLEVKMKYDFGHLILEKVLMYCRGLNDGIRSSGSDDGYGLVDEIVSDGMALATSLGADIDAYFIPTEKGSIASRSIVTNRMVMEMQVIGTVLLTTFIERTRRQVVMIETEEGDKLPEELIVTSIATDIVKGDNDLNKKVIDMFMKENDSEEYKKLYSIDGGKTMLFISLYTALNTLFRSVVLQEEDGVSEANGESDGTIH